MYHNIAEDLLRRINAGEFETKLPTEAILSARYNASRNTIRRAIDLVYQRGLIRRVQGSGYFINKLPTISKATINLSAGPGEVLHSKDYHLTSKVVTLEKIQATPALVDQMRVPLNTPLYQITRLRYLSGELYCLETAYYLVDRVPLITMEAATRSIYAFLKDTYNISVTDAENYVNQQQLTATQANLLNRSAGDAVMALSQLNYCDHTVPFNYSTTLYVAPDLQFYFHFRSLRSN